MVAKLHVRSSSAAGVLICPVKDGSSLEVFITSSVIDEAFQLSSSTERDRQDAVEANIDEIGKIVVARMTAAARGTNAITLNIDDLEGLSMHLTGNAAKKAAD